MACAPTAKRRPSERGRAHLARDAYQNGRCATGRGLFVFMLFCFDEQSRRLCAANIGAFVEMNKYRLQKVGSTHRFFDVDLSFYVCNGKNIVYKTNGFSLEKRESLLLFPANRRLNCIYFAHLFTLIE